MIKKLVQAIVISLIAKKVTDYFYSKPTATARPSSASNTADAEPFEPVPFEPVITEPLSGSAYSATGNAESATGKHENSANSAAPATGNVGIAPLSPGL